MVPHKHDIYIPENKEKYSGKHLPQIRSNWEKRACIMFDRDPRIRKWASEAVVVPYFDPTTNKDRKYYIDFLVISNEDLKIGSAIIRKDIITLIEVKPYRETKPPKMSKKKKKSTILYEAITYKKNVAKWEAAIAYCKLKNFNFQIITEKDVHF
jgi:hypothetical protein